MDGYRDDIPEPLRFSPRLHNALVADLVAQTEVAEADRLLLRRPSAQECIDHLGRQLGFSSTDGPGGIDDTLALLLPELDRMLREWPLPTDGKAVDVLAREATKSLTDLEAYATLLAGPPRWRTACLAADSTIENLGRHLRRMLHRALAASLNDLLTQWAKWDIPRMRERWEEAKQRRAQEVADLQEAERQRTLEERRLVRLETRPDRARWRRAASFQPPGRTT